MTMPVSAVERAGTSVSEKNAVDALEAAGLANWNVRKAPMMATDLESGKDVYVPDRYVTVRDRPDGRLSPLAPVGKDYKVVQNEDHAKFLDEIVDQSGGRYTQATSFKNGKLVYLTIELPDEVLVGGVDPVRMQLNGINSHDGTTNFMLNLSPERAWCANQLAYFRRNSIRFRHSGEILSKVSEARRALDITFRNVEEFKRESEMLANEAMSLAQFEKAVDRIFPAPEQPDDVSNRKIWTRWRNVRGALNEVHADSHNSAVSDTLWGGMNVIIEYLEWEHGADRNRNERIMTSSALEHKTAVVRDIFKEFALAA